MRSIIVLADRTSAMDNRLESALDLARSTGGHLTILVDTPVTRFVAMDPLGGSYVASEAMEQALAADDKFAAEIDARLASQDVPFDVLRSRCGAACRCRGGVEIERHGRRDRVEYQHTGARARE